MCGPGRRAQAEPLRRGVPHLYRVVTDGSDVGSGAEVRDPDVGSIRGETDRAVTDGNGGGHC